MRVSNVVSLCMGYFVVITFHYYVFSVIYIKAGYFFKPYRLLLFFTYIIFSILFFSYLISFFTALMSLLNLFTRSNRLFVCVYKRIFPPFFHSFIHCIINSFNQPVSHSFTYSFIHTITYSFIHSSCILSTLVTSRLARRSLPSMSQSSNSGGCPHDPQSLLPYPCLITFPITPPSLLDAPPFSPSTPFRASFPSLFTHPIRFL